MGMTKFKIVIFGLLIAAVAVAQGNISTSVRNEPANTYNTNSGPASRNSSGSTNNTKRKVSQTPTRMSNGSTRSKLTTPYQQRNQTNGKNVKSDGTDSKLDNASDPNAGENTTEGFKSEDTADGDYTTDQKGRYFSTANKFTVPTTTTKQARTMSKTQRASYDAWKVRT